MKESKVSVIVPFYNTGIKIDRCIKSIISQTYNNLEIIFINDGSTDDTISYLKKYMENDQRITVISKNNTGVGDSRNVGIEAATGDFILFIDSDDVIDNNFVQVLINYQKMYNADLVLSGVKVILDSNNFIYPYYQNENYNIYSNYDLVKKYLCFKLNTAVWGKLYSRELIKDIRFPKLNINEDFLFMWEVNKKVKNCVETHEVNYVYYLDNCDSLSKRKFSLANMSMMEYIEKVLFDCKKEYVELLEEAYNHYQACLLHNLHLYYLYLLNCNNSELYIEQRNIMLSKLTSEHKLKYYLLQNEKEYDIVDLKNKILKLSGGY